MGSEAMVQAVRVFSDRDSGKPHKKTPFVPVGTSFKVKENSFFYSLSCYGIEIIRWVYRRATLVPHDDIFIFGN
jgi:hypothetical protein